MTVVLSPAEAHQYLKQLDRVEMLSGPEYCEWPFLAQVFQEVVASPLYQQFRFVITDLSQSRLSLIKSPLDKQTVLFYTSNEDFSLPKYISEVGRVFTPYWHEAQGFSHVYPIPLGPNGYLPEPNWIPWQDRHYRVFFSGHMNKYRQGFYAACGEWLFTLNKKKLDVPTFIGWTSLFNSGLKGADYSQYLMDAHIALIPRGYSLNTFRFYEAMRNGNIIFCNQQARNHFTENCPMVVFDEDWNELTPILFKLLQQPQWLWETHQQTLAHYQQVCAPAPTAQYILNILAQYQGELE